VSFFWRLLAANALIVTSVQLGKRSPPLAGLVATMPLTTLVVMIWLYAEDPGDAGRMIGYTRGVLWGILPSIGFFMAALWCFQRRAPLTTVLATSSAVWLVGALFHRWLLR
jgi:uncharacterized membrane protein (GlpM family)